MELQLGIHEQKGQAYSVESKANARHKLQYGCFRFLAITAFSGILKGGRFCPSAAADYTKYNINLPEDAGNAGNDGNAGNVANKSKPLSKE